MYRGIGQTTEAKSADPFVFSSAKGTCLKASWPSYALLCGSARDGDLDSTLAPSPQVCGLFMDPARRDAYARIPICWEHGADPEFPATYKKPIFPWDQECGAQQKAHHVAEIAHCIRNPKFSERCALYEHPEVQALLAASCGADVYKQGRASAQSAELRQTLLIGGSALVVAGAIYLSMRKKR